MKFAIQDKFETRLIIDVNKLSLVKLFMLNEGNFISRTFNLINYLVCLPDYTIISQ